MINGVYPADIARSDRSDGGVLIAALVLLSGLITSVYILGVHQGAIQGRRQNAVEQAARMAAEELSKVSVTDSRFGEVGLIDRLISQPGQPVSTVHRVTGINTMFATLRIDLLIAEKLGLRNVAALVSADLEKADDVREALRSKLLSASFAETATSAAEGQAIWSRVGQILEKSTANTGEKLTTYSVSLGHLTKPMVTTTVSPSFEPTSSKDGFYLSGVDITMPHGKPLRFTEIRPRVTYVDANLFTPEPQYLPPTVVRVTANFDLPAQGKTPPRKVVRTACAVIGGPSELPAPATLLVSFPFGAPPQFKSIRSLLGFSNWTGDGTWLKAVDGPVPGSGHLTAEAQTAKESLLPQQAIQVAFYDWLRQSGPGIKLERVRELLDAPWPEMLPEGEASTRQNSAVTYETGARSYAVINQSEPGGTGQQLLSEVFKAKISQKSFPASALPLYIDQQGDCNLPGRQGMDKTFVLNFIQDLYETNLASIESHNIARAILDRMNTAIEQQLQNLSIEREELHSIELRLSRLRKVKDHDADPQHAVELEKQENLHRGKQEKVAAIATLLNEYEAVRARARLALRNADGAWLSTWDIGSKLSFYTRTGLHRVESPCSGYLLGLKQVFTPQRVPISEEAIYEKPMDQRQPPPQSEAFWMTPGLQVLQPADDGFIIEGLPLSEVRQRFRAPDRAQPAFLAWTSSQLISDQKLEFRSLRQSPFENSGIGKAQLLYLAADAIRSGQNPEVTWTLLIRDQVAHKGGSLGDPVRGHQGWCAENSLSFEECPGLACEIQVRAPLPLLPDLPAGPSVISPRGEERTALIPPTPLSML